MMYGIAPTTARRREPRERDDRARRVGTEVWVVVKPFHPGADRDGDDHRDGERERVLAVDQPRRAERPSTPPRGS